MLGWFALEFSSIILTNSITRPSFATTRLLADLGPVLTGDRDLYQTATAALDVIMCAAHAKSGALFRFQERPALLASVAALGFDCFPHTAIIHFASPSFAFSSLSIFQRVGSMASAQIR